jgi:acetyl esterase/lipase
MSNRHIVRVALAVVAGLLTQAVTAGAPEKIYVYPSGVLPQGATPERVEETSDDVSVWNVSQPSLTLFVPPRDKANGSAVIVAPGGGFWFLAWKHEGTEVAQRLAEEGFTAFVLRYRTDPMPDDPDAFKRESLAKLMKLITHAKEGGVPNTVFAGEKLAAADAAEAIRLVRRRAAEWGVDPKRVGFVGFSAGGITAANVSTLDPTGRPDFVGIIYGALHNPVPADAPPAFIATSADDGLLQAAAIPMFQAWQAAGRPVELHLFEKGGHGWGMTVKGLTSDHWFDEFVWWLQSRGIAGTKRP